GALAGTLEYALDLFDRETAERLAGWYRRTLEAVVASAAAVTVGGLDLPGAAALAQAAEVEAAAAEGAPGAAGAPDGPVDGRLGRPGADAVAEAGEAEGAAVEGTPGAAGAVDGSVEKRLVAYVVAAPGQSPDPEELRAHVRASLPESMVPAAVVVLDEMPLT